MTGCMETAGWRFSVDSSGRGELDCSVILVPCPRTMPESEFLFRCYQNPDNGEKGPEPLILDNLGLRDLPQLVEGAVSQLDTFVADRQPAIGIIKHAHPLADRRLGLIGRRENENHLVVLQGQRPQERALFLPGKGILETIVVA